MVCMAPHVTHWAYITSTVIYVVTVNRIHLLFRGKAHWFVYLSCLWIPLFSGLCPGNIHLDCEPFPHCQITHFLQNESFVESLRAELLQLNFNSKSNDLYKFQQVSVWIILIFCKEADGQVLKSVSSAVRWSEREKRTSCLTNKVRQSSSELLCKSFCKNFTLVLFVGISGLWFLGSFVSGCRRCCRWIWRRLLICPVPSMSIRVNHLTTSQPITGL